MFFILISILLIGYLVSIFLITLNKYRTLHYNRITKKMHQAMWDIAKQESIPIFIKSEKEMHSPRTGNLCAGWFHCPLKDGKYTPWGFRYIHILDNYRDDPWVLAHELGHYFSIKVKNDFSEEGADSWAKDLVNNSLTSIERLAMKTFVSIYFESHKIKD